jgi:uncharacterized protein
MATNNTSNRGFANMDEDKQRESASKGGKASGENRRENSQDGNNRNENNRNENDSSSDNRGRNR